MKRWGQSLTSAELNLCQLEGPWITSRRFLEIINGEISWSTLTKWCRAKKIPSQKLGRDWWLDAVALIDWHFPDHRRHAKINMDIARQIRSMAERMPQKEVAKALGLKLPLVNRVVRGNRWHE